MVNIRDWNQLKEKIHIGDILYGVVVDIKKYGVYISIGEKFHGIVLAPHISKNEYIYILNYPKIGEKIKVMVLDFSENKNNMKYSYLSLSIKHLPDY